jgi:hypothetical protein
MIRVAPPGPVDDEPLFGFVWTGASRAAHSTGVYANFPIRTGKTDASARHVG